MYHHALRLIRVFHDMNQADVADKLGLSKSYISELEQGRKKPSIEVLEKYAALFRIPLSSLLLFAERAEKANFVEEGRVFTADKVLKMLDWIVTISDTKEGNE
jgi:transcriptional regulator with XRE-family HTH domain